MKSVKFIFVSFLTLVYVNNATADLATDVEKLMVKDSSTKGAWLALKSIGWRMQVESRRGSDVEVKEGNPLEYANVEEINKAKCVVLCLSIKDDSKKSASALKTDLADDVKAKLSRLQGSTEAYRLKLAANARKVALQFTNSFRWPENGVDALGTGFDNNFQRQNITLKDLIERKLIEKGEYKSINEIYQTEEERAHYASWIKKSNVSSTTAIRSLMNGLHTSGCQIALNSVMWSLVHSSYEDTKVFDQAFDEVVLNNAYFRETKLFGKMTYDNSGLEKAKKGPSYMIGEAGYLTALFDDKVDNYDYAGENFIITGMSEAAVEDFIKVGGFGFSQKNQNRVNNHDGLSKLMIKYWKDNDERVLNRPVFTETTIWGHPGGELPLGDWLRELRELNPRTPYGGFIYEYHLAEKQWQNYFRAHTAN